MLAELYFRTYAQKFRALDRPFWNYEDGCVLTALQALYEASGDSFWRDVMIEFMNRYITPEGAALWYQPEQYSLDQIPPGRSLFFLYETTGEKRYLRAAEALAEQLLRQPCTEDGSFWHKKIYPSQIWLDGLYMASPFCLLYAEYADREYWIPRVITQFQNARTHLYSEEKGLYYHAWDEKRQQFWCNKETGLSACFWSRAMGWLVMALADCWELLAGRREKRAGCLEELWREALRGILDYQDSNSGLFWQLMDRRDLAGNYLETSASAMIAYSLLKGVRYKLFGERERRAAAAILCGLETSCFSVTASGAVRELHLEGICPGAGLGPADRPQRDGSPAYYLSERPVQDEQKGAAAVMLAYSEWMRLQENTAAELWGVQAGLNDVWLLRHKKTERI